MQNRTLRTLRISGNEDRLDNSELQREEAYWDKIGQKWLGEPPSSLSVDDPRSYLSGSAVAFEHLEGLMGDVENQTLLDYGCGSGWMSVYLARRGARVKGFDISGNLVELCRQRAAANGVSDRTEFQKMIAERLTYPDDAFDKIVGISILHHISLTEGASELYRVLKPGGSAYFIEPLGENKFFDYLRNHVFRVHHGEVREVDAEHPLTYKTIGSIGARFSETTFREFQLFEMIARVTGDTITRIVGLRALDEFLLSRFPSLRKHSRLVVIEYRK